MVYQIDNPWDKKRAKYIFVDICLLLSPRMKDEIMDQKSEYCLSFARISKESAELVGQKGFVLSRLFNAGFPVPPGFCITSYAFKKVMDENKLFELTKDLDKIRDFDDEIKAVANNIRYRVQRAKVSKEVKNVILDAYKELVGNSCSGVACRSSAPHEDGAEASFAGQYASCLNIKSSSDLISSVLTCWASAYSFRAILYRRKQGIPLFIQEFGLVIQKMINGEKSGIMFTVHPTSMKEIIVIESNYGLGESIVSGKITPDRYIFYPNTGIVEKELGSKQSITVSSNSKRSTSKGKSTSIVIDGKRFSSTVLRSSDRVITLQTPPKLRSSHTLDDKTIDDLCRLGMKIQHFLSSPQDIEWAIQKVDDHQELCLLQSRPVVNTMLDHHFAYDSQFLTTKVLATGLGVSPGNVFGRVYVACNAEKACKIKKGDILVSRVTTPEYLPGMLKSNAIITEDGSLLDHTTIVTRELGIPCVINVDRATRKLKAGKLVMLDGSSGKIYDCIENKSFEGKENKNAVKPLKSFVSISSFSPHINDYPVEGVGLLRMESFFSRLIESKSGEIENEFIRNLTLAAKAMFPRPVILRSMDFNDIELKFLGGRFEGAEDLASFKRFCRDIELLALTKAFEKGLTNIWYLIVDAKPGNELSRLVECLSNADFYQKSSFRLLFALKELVDQSEIKELMPLCDGFFVEAETIVESVFGKHSAQQLLTNNFRDKLDEEKQQKFFELRNLFKDKPANILYFKYPETYRLFSNALAISSPSNICIPLLLLDKS